MPLAADTHPVGAMDRTQLPDQRLAGLVLQLLQGWGRDVDGWSCGLGFQLAGAFGENVEHDFTHAGVSLSFRFHPWADLVAHGVGAGYGEPASRQEPIRPCGGGSLPKRGLVSGGGQAGAWNQTARVIVNRAEGRGDGQLLSSGQELPPGLERYRSYASRPRRANTSSSYRGVSFRRRTGLWIAQVYWRGKRYYLGSFRSEVEAARAYNRHAAAIIGSLALLNDVGHGDGPDFAAPNLVVPEPAVTGGAAADLAEHRGAA